MNKGQIEHIAPGTIAEAGVGRAAGICEGITPKGHYVVECVGADGEIKWTDTIENLVTDTGRNDVLDKYLAGVSYTAAWYLMLIGSTSYTTGVAAADTASSHAGWAESTAYSNSTRPAASWSAASGQSKALSAPASFSINGADTIKGCALISNSTKGGTTGTLYSAGLFTGGDKAVANTDTLNVTYTATD